MRRVLLMSWSLASLARGRVHGGPELHAAADRRCRRPIATSRRRRLPPTAPSLADTPWFEVFKDDTLTALVRTALERNFDVRIAAERVIQARERFRITRSQQFPTVDAAAVGHVEPPLRDRLGDPAAQRAPAGRRRCAPTSGPPGSSTCGAGCAG